MAIAPVKERYYLGIDGGGSKCLASVADADGRVLGSSLAGPANPFHGVEAARQSIESAARGALEAAGLPSVSLDRLVVGAGLAGVNLPGLYRVMSEWDHPFAAFYLATDLRIACIGAHQSDEGAIIVTGTGSCGYVRVGGEERLIGGHGFSFGDQGSGAWMGLEAIRAVLLAADELGPETRLTEDIAGELGASGLALVERMSGRASSDYARLAPLVLNAAEAGDPVARSIVEQGAEYISAMAHRLLSDNPPRLSMIGGLSERLQPWLEADVVARLSSPLGSPDVGAIMYARRQEVSGADTKKPRTQGSRLKRRIRPETGRQ